jgi:hypothetical protein
VNSHTTASFRQAFNQLSKQMQKQACKAYRHFQTDPNYPGLRFKKVHPMKPIYSVRVGKGHRAVGILEGEEIVWFWIGSHKEYERVISKTSKTG